MNTVTPKPKSKAALITENPFDKLSIVSSDELLCLEEYKVHTTFILDSQQRISTILIGTIGLSTTLLSGAAAVVNGIVDSENLLLIYVALFPSFIVIPALLLITGHREGIGRTAAYLMVGIERQLRIDGYESRLARLRMNQAKSSRKESEDGLVWVFGAILVACFFVFVYGLLRVLPPTTWTFYLHLLLTPSIIFGAYWKVSKMFLTAIRRSLEQSVSEWESVCCNSDG